VPFFLGGLFLGGSHLVGVFPKSKKKTHGPTKHNRSTKCLEHFNQSIYCFPSLPFPLSSSCFYGRLVTTLGHYSCGSDIIATQKIK
jgi:hypothetical protein